MSRTPVDDATFAQIAELFRYDADRIALVGGSLGGHIGCLVTGLDDRFAAVVLTVIGAWVEGDTDDPVSRYVNMLNFAPRTSAPVLMVNATGDGREPGEELYNDPI